MFASLLVIKNVGPCLKQQSIQVELMPQPVSRSSFEAGLAACTLHEMFSAVDCLLNWWLHS